MRNRRGVKNRGRKRRGSQRKGVILDLQKRREVLKGSPVDPAVLSKEAGDVRDLLRSVFGEDETDPYAAMAGMSLLLVEMALSDGQSKTRFLQQVELLYEAVRAQLQERGTLPPTNNHPTG